MKHLKNYSDYLKEALSLSTAKKYTKGWDSTRWRDLFQQWTDDPKAYRIYLPFEPDRVDAQVPEPVDSFLDGIGWEVEDYNSGLAKERSSGRSMKIGKLINKHGDPELLKVFTGDPGRLRPREWEIVVSRHPYDLAGMSTGRGWVSCMQLGVQDRGEIYIPQDIKAGSIIAYLIRRGDRNLENPAARILIKPYASVDQPSETILVADRTVYGQFIPGFLDSVQDWLDKVNKGKSGVYRIDSRLYPENDEYDATVVAQGILDSGSLSPKSIYYYALIPEADPQVLDRMADSKSADSRALIAIALHRNTPAATLERLAQTGGSSVKRAVAANSAAPVETRVRLIESLTKKQLMQMMHHLQSNTSLTSDMISTIWNRTLPDGDPVSVDAEIRLQLSTQKNVPLDLLKEMSVDPYPNIRSNSIRTPEIARRLLEDPSQQVRRRAQQHLENFESSQKTGPDRTP